MRKAAALLAVILTLSLTLGVIGCGGGGNETAEPSPTSTAPAAAGKIKIGVIGPMEYVQGRHHWYGAQMARDEINAAGGVDVAGEKYLIELKKADSNELLSASDAVTAMERLITSDKAQFVVGGIRSEAVLAMQEVAMDNHTIFLGCGASEAELNLNVSKNYDRYKYWFRVTPFSGIYLVQNVLNTLGMAGAIVQQQFQVDGKLQVAIIAENAAWAEPAVKGLKAFIPALLGMEVAGVWRPSSTATDVSTELSGIEDSGAHFVVPILSGPVGIPYGKQFGELQIPAASIGINVEAQKLGFWDATDGYGNYETDLNFYAQDVAITPQTIPWVNAFMEKFGEIPTYNAGTYDAIKLLAEAIERAGSLDPDAIVPELEKTDYVGPGARIAFTPTTHEQPHDIIYGPGYATGIATQWHDGKMKCVWPNLGKDEWEGIKYEGTVMWQVPPKLAERFTR